MLWFLLAQVDDTVGVSPANVRLTPEAHYMRIQARTLTCLELWSISRGDDFRSDSQHFSVGKLFGAYANKEVVGPDAFYKMQLLKDDSKANKMGRPEIVGVTRNKDPLVGAINAVATMLILRFGRGGVLGELPSFFDEHNDWPNEHGFLTLDNGTGAMPYKGSQAEPGHLQLFQDMKQAAGLTGIMHDSQTKLRSFGAMNASEFQASHPEIERAGRWNQGGAKASGSAGDAGCLNRHYLRNLSIEVALANAGFNAKYWNHYILPRSRGSSLQAGATKNFFACSE